MLHKQSLYRLLFEQDSKVNDAPEGDVKLSSSGVKARKPLNSVDKQIDALILKYESASIIEDEDNLNENLSLKFLLEQDEEEAAEEEAPDEDTGATDTDTGTSGAEGMKADSPGKEETPNLDVDDFTSKCVRLITNYRNLLRIEEAIVNRVRNFLDNNYGDEHVERFLNTLENDYGISADEFEDESQENNAPEKFAPGASGGSSGA
jgi:hypothetical protein